MIYRRRASPLHAARAAVGAAFALTDELPLPRPIVREWVTTAT